MMGTTLEPIDPDSRSLGGAATPPGPPPDAKRMLTRQNLLRTIGDVVVSAPALLPALVRPKTSHALREKIMLAVSSVNECGYCQWGHSQLASVQGVSLEEINEILGFQSLEAATSSEAAAILFAQSYAENGGRVDAECDCHTPHALQRGGGRRDPRVRACDHAREPDRQHGRRRGRSHPQPCPRGARTPVTQVIRLPAGI